MILIKWKSLSGFGKKKKENKTYSKKLQKLSERELKAKSINNHIKGNLDEAEKGYIAFSSDNFDSSYLPKLFKINPLIQYPFGRLGFNLIASSMIVSAFCKLFNL